MAGRYDTALPDVAAAPDGAAPVNDRDSPGSPLAADARASRREHDRRAVAELEHALHVTAWPRRVFYAASLVFPSVVAVLLTFLAFSPVCFVPDGKLTTTLASMVGAGLSFAGVSFSAAIGYADHPSHALRLKTAGSMLLRFGIAMAVSLALAQTRERLLTDFGPANVLDLPLRACTGIVTLAAVGMAFIGFRTLVLLLGPELEEDATRSLREWLVRPASAGPAGDASRDARRR